MDTTAAAELGMLADAGGVDGVGFWDSGDVDPSSWGGEEEEEEDDAEEDFLWERAAAVVASQAAAQGPPGRQQRQSSSSAGMEPPSKKRSKPAPPDEASPGAGGRGSGSNSGRGNSQHVGGGQGFAPAGGGVVVGAGAVGRGRGTGSIFYKTKLCSRFRSGNCPYNTNCNFAHGMEELRKPPPGWEEFVASQELPPAMPASQSPSHGGAGGGAAGGGGGSTDSQVRFHKTRPCKKYFGEGNCPYGEKCNFLHDEQSAPRAVREARETAAPLLSTPKTESSSLSAEGPAKDALASNSAATASAAAAGSITPRPLNWKTRLCNKWETTGQCPFGDKCHFAHGSDELQMYGGGPLDPNAPAPTISDSGGSPNKSPSETGTDSSILYNDVGPRQRQLNAGASQQNSSRGFSGGGLKAFTNWKGPTDISTIYGDWIDEEEEWEHDSRGDQESLGAESNAKSGEQLPLPHQQQNVAFFRGGNGRHISRQSNIQTHGFSSSAKNGGAGHVTGLLGVEPG